ncbi:unnamed protein product, partial [Porites lobata]
VPTSFEVSAKPDGCYAALSWKTPTYNNCPITRYSVHYKPSNQLIKWQTTNLLAPNKTKYRLKLNCSSTYEIMVLAWNERGSSIKDTKLLAVTTEEGVPFRLETPGVKKRPCGVFEVTWNPPSSDSGGGPLTGYQVQLHTSGGGNGGLRNCTALFSNHSCLFTDLRSETEYQIRVRAFNKKGPGQWAHTSKKMDLIGPPDVSEIINNETEIPGITPNVTVQWTRPNETYCNITMYSLRYRAVQPATEKITEINITNASLTSFELHFQHSKKYEVTVFAWNKLGRNVPSTPVFNVIPSENENECAVFVQWLREPSSSDCPILFHTISYRRQGKSGWKRLNITEANTNRQKLETECSTEYEFQLVAWNEVGSSPFTTKTYTTKVTELKTNERGISLEFILIYTFAGLLTILGAILLVVCINSYRKRGNRSTKRTAKDIQVLVGCEIPPVRTEFLELLGEGAFGKVHKATLMDGMAYFEDERDWACKPRKQRIVAVKELFENANEEDKKEFMDEIELMKKVGKHQNVLSFFGCWTTTKPILLMVEYIAHGDLLHWLRHKRAQISSSMLKVTPRAAAKETELYAGTPTWNTNVIGDQDTQRVEDRPNNFEASRGPSSTPDGKKEQGEQSDFNDDDQCKIPMTVFWSSIQEENAAPKTDEKECDNKCETFHPTDAMSFAWQIARGMSYLSEKGLVHRDLAARNILVGHGKKLKIGDFGLMRETYHELYEVKKQKKLPIKWLAPEAIYEQIFTSKSDVWSYGIVMWEIATLGGSPYPLLNNAEVMSLLKTGHRLEKPDLCSDNFYAFMMECWKQNPDERPSFQELVERLERTMTEQVEYLDLKQLDETKTYYQVQESKTGEIGGDSELGMHRAVSLISIAV